MLYWSCDIFKKNVGNDKNIYFDYLTINDTERSAKVAMLSDTILPDGQDDSLKIEFEPNDYRLLEWLRGCFDRKGIVDIANEFDFLATEIVTVAKLYDPLNDIFPTEMLKMVPVCCQETPAFQNPVMAYLYHKKGRVPVFVTEQITKSIYKVVLLEEIEYDIGKGAEKVLELNSLMVDRSCMSCVKQNRFSQKKFKKYAQSLIRH